MLTTKTGNVSAPIPMNGDDRKGSCRDKGRMWGRVGALCLSWWQRDPLGFRRAPRSHPNQDKHKAPSSTPPRPLSLQDAGGHFLLFPSSVVTIHQDGDLYMTDLACQYS